MLKFLNPAVVAVFVLVAGQSFAGGDKFGLGRLATTDEVAAWDTDVRPDGQGLPVGSGDAYTGEEIFAEKCAVCHGDFGEAVGRWPVLAGGHDTLTSDRPVKTIGSYWPYLSTVFDYVNRAMPFGDARSLTPDEVYSITAYLLYVNDLVEEDFELNSDNFTSISLPNEDNFYDDDRATTELIAFSGDVCMVDCKDSVEITAHAAVVDVTPEETAVAAETVQVAAVEPVAAEPEPVEVIDPELIASGKKVFKKCKACHQIGEGAKNRTGPMLNGVVGRAAGSVEGFRYSKALVAAAGSGLTWDIQELSLFLTKPRDFLKGTKMSFPGLKKQADLDAVIAYMQSIAE